MNTVNTSIQERISLLTPDETSILLGLSVGTLTVWRSTGRYDLPFIKVGSKVMYRLEDIQDFIERRTRVQTEWKPKNA